MRGRNIVQLLRAVDLLSQPEGISINRLSRSLEIDRRSVYRLLDIIQDLGFPIFDEEQDSSREKSWKLDSDYIIKLPNITLPDVRLNLAEVLALYFLKTESSVFEGTDIAERIRSAYGKLSQFLPANIQTRVNKLNSLFLSSQKITKDYSGKQEIIDSLAQAMIKEKTCLIHYFSFTDEKSKCFRIDPLYFFESSGGLYIFIRATRFDEIRILAVERIESIEEQESGFEYPEEFDAEAILANSFDLVYDEPIDLKVVFSPNQAKYIKERIFSADQEIIDNEDGSIIFKMKTSGWFDVKRWLLGHGPEVRVLEPEKLRQEILEEINNVLNEYANPSFG
ncbi:MAG: helix-turn-helix transcriptional regulator [Desulfonatronovibrionaceae bacterium]